MRFYEYEGDPALEASARVLEASGDYLILRRIPQPHELWVAPTPIHGPDIRLAIVDSETTGLGADDRMIEFALVTVALDADGQLCHVSHPISGLEDPGVSLDPEIVTVTGIDDTMVAGKRFDEDVLRDQLADVDAIVAFNAKFDRHYWQARFPWIDLPWICAQRDIDWPAQGYVGRGQAQLLMARGFFYPAHRAATDAWALTVLLATQAVDGRTIAANLVDGARRTTYRVRAVGAPYGCRERLKHAGYRWDAHERVWWIDVEESGLDAELAVLMEMHPFIRPTHEALDWFDRHR